MDVDVSTLLVVGAFVAAQVFQTIQVAVLGRQVRRTLRPPAIEKLKRQFRGDDDDEDTHPKGKRQ